MANRYTAYCGLYCGHCFSRTHVKPAAETLMDTMKRQGFEGFGPAMQGYNEFWAFLQTLIDAEGCPGCKQGGGGEDCEMRHCARDKRLVACPLCEEYPCDRFAWMPASTHYPMLEEDNHHMREHGFAAWLAMQQQRRAQGFTYLEQRERLAAGEMEPPQGALDTKPGL